MFFFRETVAHRIHVWYSIFTYIYHKNQPNVGIYTIHGSIGSVVDPIVGRSIEMNVMSSREMTFHKHGFSLGVECTTSSDSSTRQTNPFGVSGEVRNGCCRLRYYPDDPCVYGIFTYI